VTTIVTRAQWGARAARPGGNVFSTILGLAVHWEDAPPPTAHSGCAAAVRAIQKFHMDVRGWNDLAYNFVACNHDYLFQGRVGGCAANGTDYGNQHFKAVCWLGGPGHTPTDGALSAMAYCRTHQGLDGDPIYPHSHFYPTDCPGDSLRGWIAGGAKDPTKPPVPRPEKHWQVMGPDGVLRIYTLGELTDYFGRQQDAHADDPTGTPDRVYAVTRKADPIGA
jgi:hypothetical protein